MDPIKWILQVPGYDFSWSFFLSQIEMVNIGHLWYLPCLFVIFAVSYPLFLFFGKSWVASVLIFIATLGLSYKAFSFPEIFQIQNAMYYLVYFIFGYIISFAIDKVAGYDWRIVQRLKCNRTLYVALITGLIVLSAIAGFAIHRFSSIAYDYYLSFVVLILLYMLVPRKTTAWISKISENSYGIYLFHSPLIYITAMLAPNMSPILMVIINFFIFGGVAYAMSAALSGSRLKFIIGK